VLREAAILSTCNRVEVYGVAEDSERAREGLVEFLHAFHHLPPGSVTPSLFSLDGVDAVKHLFATTCGLNSLVLGEGQIQAQVREASGFASGYHALGATLNALFRQALEVGKRARTETNISRSAASISHAGVELARRLLGGLSGAHVLLVGSGKMSELAAKNLVDNGAASISLVNRTVENAERLAEQWGARALPFEALTDALSEVDVVLSSTSAPHTVIRAEHVRAALKDRPERPLLLIDLAVPRDIDVDVADVAGAHIYDIDDLEEVVSANLQRRRDEIGAVRSIVDEETDRFMAWLSARTVVPTLNRLRAQADAIGRGELDKAMRRLQSLDERERNVIETLVGNIVNKLLHQPTIRLKQEAAQGNGVAYAEALQYLFNLEAEPYGA
jgi:glutamyl-tRNA reductase